MEYRESTDPFAQGIIVLSDKELAAVQVEDPAEADRAAREIGYSFGMSSAGRQTSELDLYGAANASDLPHARSIGIGFADALSVSSALAAANRITKEYPKLSAEIARYQEALWRHEGVLEGELPMEVLDKFKFKESS